MKVTIELKLKGNKTKLDLDEARELYEELDELFGKEIEYRYPNYYQPYWYYSPTTYTPTVYDTGTAATTTGTVTTTNPDLGNLYSFSIEKAGG